MDLTIIFYSILAVSAISLFISVIIILSERFILNYGECSIKINGRDDKILKINGGVNLLAGLKPHNIFIPSACGGGGSCGMCKVTVRSGGGQTLVTEESSLTKKEIKENVRLACQVKIRNDMEIEIPEELFNVRRLKAVVISNANVATFIKELVLKLDDDIELDFKAGQYVQIEAPKYSLKFSEFHIDEHYRQDWDACRLWEYSVNNKSTVERAYSMASYPAEKNIIKLTVRIATPPIKKFQPGLCSSYIFNLKPGDKVDLTGPYGDFLIKESEGEMCYIGGGAGMAPMRSHIFHLFHTLKTSRKVTFWYGGRSKKEIFYEEEYRKIEEQFPNFKFTIALSEPKPEDNWTGATGFIHQVLYEQYLSKHPAPEKIEYYLCGPEPMINAVTETLKKLNIPDSKIMYDKF